MAFLVDPCISMRECTTGWPQALFDKTKHFFESIVSNVDQSQ